MANELTIYDLPDRVLEIVFCKLTLSQRKTVRLVCKNWLQMCNSAVITQNELIRIQLKDLHQFKTLRGCLNIDIDNKDSQSTNFKEQKEFWIAHGNSVRSLNLKIFDRQHLIGYNVVNYCPNIEHLTILYTSDSSVNCFEEDENLQVEKLDCLLSLTLQGCASLPFGKISLPQLKRLVLISKDYSYQPVRIVKLASNLTELVLNFCILLEDIFQEVGPNLTGLYMSEPFSNSIEYFIKQVEKFPNLKNLQLNNVVVAEYPLSRLLILRKLEFISISGVIFCEEDILQLLELEQLKGLDISRTQCTGDVIIKCFGKKVFPNLIALQMQWLKCLTDDILATILPNLPNLKFLDLRMCQEVGSNAVHAIASNCQQLTHLCLRDCDGITRFMEPNSINSLEKLVHLDLSNNPAPCNPINVVQLRLGKLKTLGLAGVSLSPEQRLAIFTNCPNLKRLWSRIEIPVSVNHREIPYFTIFDFCT